MTMREKAGAAAAAKESKRCLPKTHETSRLPNDCVCASLLDAEVICVDSLNVAAGLKI